MAQLKDYVIVQPKSKIKAGEGLIKGEYKFFTSSNTQTKWLNQFQYNKPALIFGTGGMASVHYCDTPFSTSTDCIVMYAKSNLNLEYVYRYLESHMYILENGFKGVGLKHISKEYILSISIPEVDLYQQESLVASARKIDEIIYARQNQLTKVDELVKSRFIEMFGDVIRNDKGWKQCRFSDITTSRLGKMLDSKQQTGKCSYPYLANFNVQWFRFELDKLNVMDFNEEDRKEFELIDGDLLVCEGGEIGRCAVWHNEIQPCFFQKALHRVRCNKDIILPDYMAYWFKYNCDHNGFSDIEGAKATIAHLPGAKLKNLMVTVPSISLQTEFATFIEQIDKLRFEVKNSLEKLETMKNALMQQYFG